MAFQTTVPLVLGLQLEGASYTLAAGTGSVPINGKNANLFTSASAADLGTTVPLILGLNLGTAGATSYVLTAGTGSVPIITQPANLAFSADTMDAQTTVPLALGMLLAVQSFTLVGDGTTIVLDFSPSDSEVFDTPDRQDPGGGRRRRDLQRQAVELRAKERDELDVLEIIMAIAHGTVCH